MNYVALLLKRTSSSTGKHTRASSSMGKLAAPAKLKPVHYSIFIKLKANVERKRRNKSIVRGLWTKQHEGTGICGACAIKCRKQCNHFHQAVSSTAGEAKAHDVDSAAKQPKLRRMNASADLSEYAAECSQSFGNRHDNEAGVADSPNSAESIREAPLLGSDESDNSSEDSSAVLISEHFSFGGRGNPYWIATFTPPCVTKPMRIEMLPHDNGTWEKRYYIEGRAVTKEEFDRAGGSSVERIEGGTYSMK